MAKTFQKQCQSANHIQETQRISTRTNSKNHTLRPIIFRFQKTKNKEKILKSEQKNTLAVEEHRYKL